MAARKSRSPRSSRKAESSPPSAPEQAQPADAIAESEVAEPVTRRDRLTMAATLLVLFAFFGTWGQFDFSNVMGYYDLFADGLAEGQLSLLITPEQANLVDMIPYEGRYYFNWGPFPVIFHFAARAVGLRLSDRVASLAAGFLAALLLLEVFLLLRRRYSPEAPKGLLIWLFFCFALGTTTALTSFRGTVYNESIGFAALFTLGALWAYLRFQEKLEPGWLALAGALVGAAAFTRITTVLFAVPLFLAAAAEFHYRKRQVRAAALVLALLSAPVIAGGVANMVNNQARFGSPFDFGRLYKPETKNPEIGAFRLAVIPENIGHYLFSLPTFSGDFPYVAHEGNQPVRNVTRAEAMSSLILGSPFFLLAAGVIPLARRKDAPAHLRIAGVLTLGGALMMFAVMMTFAAASRRYAQDFTPWLMTAVFLGAAHWIGTRERWRKWRAPAWAAFALAAVINIHVPFYQNFVTPTPDVNVMRAFVGLTPALEAIAPGPQLREEASIAAHDLGTLYAQQGRWGKALEAFEKAARWNPDEPRIQQNLERVRRMLRR